MILAISDTTLWASIAVVIAALAQMIGNIGKAAIDAWAVVWKTKYEATIQQQKTTTSTQSSAPSPTPVTKSTTPQSGRLETLLWTVMLLYSVWRLWTLVWGTSSPPSRREVLLIVVCGMAIFVFGVGLLVKAMLFLAYRKLRKQFPNLEG